MIWNRKKYRRQIKAFLDNLKNPVFHKEYLDYHRVRIYTLEWLLAYYENRAATTPRGLLESTMGNPHLSYEDKLVQIQLLYFWVYYKRIEGF